MDIQTLIELCKAYAGLGWAVQEQMDNVGCGDDLSEQNPNALKMIAAFLRKAEGADVEDAGDFADQIEEYLAK